MTDGGPAFPHEENAEHNGNCGMSLRDYFAASVLAEMISTWTFNDNWPAPGEASRLAYVFADEMLIARGQKR